MAPPRRFWVKLKVPVEVLNKLPKFEPPISKSRLKRIAAEEKRNGTFNTGSDSIGNSKTSSPQPESSNYRINSGLKETSTSGLTMNSISSGIALDKSGKPSNKFVKRQRQFKTFSGFKVKYVSWKIKRERERKEKDKTVKAAEKTVAEPTLGELNSVYPKLEVMPPPPTSTIIAPPESQPINLQGETQISQV